jgi:hypothetical protein
MGDLGRQAPGGTFVFVIGKGNVSRLFGGEVASQPKALQIFAQRPVERVVLNTLGKECGAVPPGNICACSDLLPSIRAGLAFSGEVDPP